ncbi:hypothetical protein Hanom_Chr01g00036241 [Helianthus anomalus]
MHKHTVKSVRTQGLGPSNKGASFFSDLSPLLAVGRFEPLSGETKSLDATSGGSSTTSSPGRTTSPFSLREDGSL